MATPTYEYNGKSQSLAKWSKEIGIPTATLRERISKLGWSVQRALTTDPDSVSNRMPGYGKQLRSSVVSSLLKVWDECGRKEFEVQVAAAFRQDALKTIKDFQFLLPKEQDASDNKPTAAVQINNVIDPASFAARYEPV